MAIIANVSAMSSGGLELLTLNLDKMSKKKTKLQEPINPPLLIASVSGSVFKGDCDKNIHWYAGVYSQGQWIYNECSYCKKRQNV